MAGYADVPNGGRTIEAAQSHSGVIRGCGLLGEYMTRT